MLTLRKDEFQYEVKPGSKLKVTQKINCLEPGDKVTVMYVTDVIGGDGTQEPYAALEDRGEPIYSQNYGESPCYLMPIFPLWMDWWEFDD